MNLKNLIFIKLIFLLNFSIYQNTFADNHNISEVLELIQKDIKTLEKAIYSGSSEINSETSKSTNLDSNSEDVLTRHLLKLSEVENQFQQLTNRFEEINFKLDKLSNRLSKVQADNQIRFQDIEDAIMSEDNIKKITKKKLDKNDNILPGSSEPQDLGSISYKDTNTNETTQKTQSIETTASIVTETFQAEEKILPNIEPNKQYEFATSFLKVGDYPTAERAFREFVLSNPNHELAGNNTRTKRLLSALNTDKITYENNEGIVETLRKQSHNNNRSNKAWEFEKDANALFTQADSIKKIADQTNNEVERLMLITASNEMMHNAKEKQASAIKKYQESKAEPDEPNFIAEFRKEFSIEGELTESKPSEILEEEKEAEEELISEIPETSIKLLCEDGIVSK